MTTRGPGVLAPRRPVVTKMPPPTTLAMPSAVRLNGPTALESSRARSRFALQDDRVERARRGRDPSMGKT